MSAPTAGQLTIAGATVKLCETCGGAFVPRRSTARYCTSACRQVAYRIRRGAERDCGRWTARRAT
ncbi:hypothetical protein GKE82_05845 [Conexibacter sp. W3-3-2]|uniref:hypothetical protein n=1 Tax=Conexibacter sp. W3-3-2 TaxID=2675227 RepID=UPI0012B7F3BB|nr:hypothetical protein [Conexibacter sp. W3-3-2]MTD43838.1 hypothetical protein [Conexibacter sp. W3-3-2]